jgi:hypothetical protein
MTRLKNAAWTAGVAAALGMASLAAAQNPSRGLSSADLAQERQLVEQWKTRRLASLTSETGWLTLAGLYWLKPGENTFGRAKSNALPLDNQSLANEAGSFVLKAAVRCCARASVTRRRACQRMMRRHHPASPRC